MDLRDRGHALEGAFFQDLNKDLIQKMKAKAARAEDLSELSAATGIEEETALNRLIDNGVTAATLAAMVCVPLIHVAYADTTLDDKERAAVLKAAAEAGVVEGSAAAELLETWLNKGPNEALFADWSNYIGSLKSHLSTEQFVAMKNRVLSNCHAVAQASGGFLGMGTESGTEKHAIRAVEAAFK